jgi:hypothetical protein
MGALAPKHQPPDQEARTELDPRYAPRLWFLRALDHLIGHPGIVLHFLFFACLYVLAGHKDLRLSRVLALREDETVA